MIDASTGFYKVLMKICFANLMQFAVKINWRVTLFHGGATLTTMSSNDTRKLSPLLKAINKKGPIR